MYILESFTAESSPLKMTRHIGLNMLMVIFCSLVYFKIECVECASYILEENPDVHINLNKPISESKVDQQQDADIAHCCSNISCIYDTVEKGLKFSQGFENLKEHVLIDSESVPDFILIDVHVTWTKFESTTGTLLNQMDNMSYIWGETQIKAVFGPVQDVFQSVPLFSGVLSTLALIEQSIISKELVTHNSENLEAWTVEKNQSITLNISDTCISEELKQELSNCITEVLKQVRQVFKKMNKVSMNHKLL